MFRSLRFLCDHPSSVIKTFQSLNSCSLARINPYAIFMNHQCKRKEAKSLPRLFLVTLICWLISSHFVFHAVFNKHIYKWICFHCPMRKFTKSSEKFAQKVYPLLCEKACINFMNVVLSKSIKYSAWHFDW